MGFAQKQLGFERPPKLFLKQDAENAKNMLGKTAFYDPQAESITLFVSSRHPKDILRSLAHELVHHTQNLRGDLSPEKCGEMGMGYAQNNAHLREMEREAYERGNLCFRDWEDGYKFQLQQEQKVKSLKESKTMTVKISKDELKDLILKVLKEEKAVTTEKADPLTTALRDPIAYLGYFGFHQDGRKINAYDDAEMAKKGEAYPRFSKEGDPAQSYARSIQFGADDLRKARIKRGMMQRGSDIKAKGAFTKGLEAGEKAAATRKELERAAADQWDQYSTMDVLKAKGDLQKRALPGAGLRNLVQLQKRVGAENTGEYDEQTMDRIAKLQRLVGAKDDGIFGRNTARAFKRYIARRKREKQQRAIARRKREREQMIKSPIAKAMEEPPVLANQPTMPESVELNEGSKPKAADNKKKKEDVKAAMKKKTKDSGLADALKGVAELTKEAGCGDHSAKRDEEVVLDEMGMCEVCMLTPCGCPSMEEAAESTKKYDDDPALKGGQDELPDHLQKAIIDKEDKKSTDESRVYTPEKEKALYESRYNVRNDAIFDTLKKLWTK